MKAIIEIEIADAEKLGVAQLVKMLTKVAAEVLHAGNVRPATIADAAGKAELCLEVDARCT